MAAVKKGVRLLLLGLLTAFSVGYVAPYLTSLSYVVPLLNVKLSEAAALAIGIFAGDWVLDQFPQTKGSV